MKRRFDSLPGALLFEAAILLAFGVILGRAQEVVEGAAGPQRVPKDPLKEERVGERLVVPPPGGGLRSQP